MNKLATIVTASSLLLAGVITLSALAEQEPLDTADVVDSGKTRAVGASVEYTSVGETDITVSFGSGVFPPSGGVNATVVVDKDVANSPFTGNYITNYINTLQFNVSGDGSEPAVAWVYLNYKSSTRKEWRVGFTVSRTPDEVVTISLPLTIEAGWSAEGEGNQYAMFAQALQDVESVMIRLQPGDPDNTGTLLPQSYTFSDFVVINDDGISSEPGSLSDLEEALISNFSYGYGSVDALTDDMKTWDQDADGMADYVEIMSEHDEDYANSIFAAEDIVKANDGIELTWVCVEGETYSVLRSESMQGTFSAVPALVGLIASDTGYMTEKDGSDEVVNGEGPFFYRIRKD